MSWSHVVGVPIGSHVKCSFAVPEGRACASHFDVINPLDKQVVASMEDDTIPVALQRTISMSKHSSSKDY